MQRVQDVLGACFVPVEFVGDVRFTMDRAPACQGHDLPVRRTFYRFLDIEPHPADLLHKELAASSGTFIVRKHICDLSICQEVHQEGLAAQRSDCVKIAAELGQSPLYCGNLGDMTSPAGHSEPVCSAKLLPSEHFLEDLAEHRALMRELGHLIGEPEPPDVLAILQHGYDQGFKARRRAVSR